MYILISNAKAKSGTMCPMRTVGRPGMVMPHTCVNCTLSPSGRLIVNSLDATLFFATLTPSMINMEVALVAVIACNVAIMMVFKVLCEVGPNNAWAAMAHACGLCVRTRTLPKEEQFDVMTVVSLLHLPMVRV
jgi:hypothetical protein